MEIVVTVSLLSIAVLGLLVWYLARSGRPRTWAWALLLSVAVVAGLMVLALALINYTVPLGWWLALAVCGGAIVVTFMLVGRGVRWRPLPVLASLGVVVTAFLLGVTALFVVPFLPAPLVEARAGQIADAAGFVALLPSGQVLQASYQPVNALPEPCTGLSVEYDRFSLQERPSNGPMTSDDLAALVAPGARPVCEGSTVPDDVTSGDATVQGAPAVTAEFLDVPPEALEKPEPRRATTLLAVELDGVQVILWSVASEDCSSGDCVHVEPLTTGELVAVADTLEPVG